MFDQDRTAVANRDDRLRQVFNLTDATTAADQKLFVGAFHETAGTDGVRLLDSMTDVFQRQVVVNELRGIHYHLVLLQLASDHNDLGYTRNREQAGSENPVRKRTEIHVGRLAPSFHGNQHDLAHR